MDKETLKSRLESIADETMMELIIEEVLRRITEEMQEEFNCLLVFHGALRGADKALESLKELKDHPGIHLMAAWTEEASGILDAGKLKEITGADPLPLDDPRVRDYQRTADLIALPTLTLSSAAKISCCIRDDIASKFVSDAILDGKHIIAAVDGVVLDKPHAPTAYLNRITAHLVQLAEFGIDLTIADKLGSEILRISGEARGDEAQTAADHASRVTIRDHIITKDLLLDISAGSRLIIAKNAIIGPVAKDWIYEKRMEVIRE